MSPASIFTIADHANGALSTDLRPDAVFQPRDRPLQTITFMYGGGIAEPHGLANPIMGITDFQDVLATWPNKDG